MEKNTLDAVKTVKENGGVLLKSIQKELWKRINGLVVMNIVQQMTVCLMLWLLISYYRIFSQDFVGDLVLPFGLCKCSSDASIFSIPNTTQTDHFSLSLRTTELTELTLFSKVCFEICQNVKNIGPPNCSGFGNSLPEPTKPTDCQKLTRRFGQTDPCV